MSKKYIICVDDEKIVLESLKTELKEQFGKEYRIETADNATDAMELIEELLTENSEIPVVISDYVMPLIKGDELLKNIHAVSPKTLKILLTGQATMEGVTNSINNANLYRYIAKPWETKDLSMTVTEAIRRFFQEKQLEIQNAQLRELNAGLEKKVKERTREIQEKSELLEQKNVELSQKNKDITDSLYYAKNIQKALLSSEQALFEFFPDSFVYNRPRDIVSGDFFWLRGIEEYVLIAVADCTGHGVPGAFMSILGVTLLNEITTIDSTLCANKILTKLRQNLLAALRKGQTANEPKDGMNIALCLINRKTGVSRYSGAYHPVVICKANNCDYPVEIKGDRMPIGYYPVEHEFSEIQFQLSDGDSLYMFSDGYVDQFQHNSHKKFMKRQLMHVFHEINKLPMNRQLAEISSRMEKWKGNTPQIDDMLVVGFRFV
jgi:serine phosphatase RsbU (regulator of sigma subunit)